MIIKNYIYATKNKTLVNDSLELDNFNYINFYNIISKSFNNL